jgi:hypothetical protein
MCLIYAQISSKLGRLTGLPSQHFWIKLGKQTRQFGGGYFPHSDMMIERLHCRVPGFFKWKKFTAQSKYKTIHMFCHGIGPPRLLITMLKYINPSGNKHRAANVRCLVCTCNTTRLHGAKVRHYGGTKMLFQWREQQTFRARLTALAKNVFWFEIVMH